MNLIIRHVAILSLFIIIIPLCATAEDLNDADVLDAQAKRLYQAGKHIEAIRYIERSLSIREKVLGKEHPKVGFTLNDLAGINSAIGRYNEAELLYKRSLAIAEKTLGASHPNVAICLKNLAGLYYSTHRYTEAEPLYKRSLAIEENALGENHPDVANSVNELANLYDLMGRYADAEPLYKRSLEIREKVLGKNHKKVAVSLNNLAKVYYSTGRYSEAELLFTRSVAIYEKSMGKEHTDVANSISNLASLYIAMGRYADAEPLYKRSLEIREKVLGENHPDVAISINNLAMHYVYMGRYAEAEPLYKRSIAIFEKALGENHTNVASILSNLGGLYVTTGRYAEAEPVLKRALAIRENVLGVNHPDVANTLNKEAEIYYATGRYAEAEPVLTRSLAIEKNTLGENHPNVALQLSNLATLYISTGRYTAAESLFKKSLAIAEKTLGKSHPNVATSLNNLADIYMSTGRYTEAEPLYKRSLAIREQVLGANHPDVATTVKNLALLYAMRGNRTEAHDGFRKATAISEYVRKEIFPVLNDRQKFNYMNLNKVNIHIFLSYTVFHLSSSSSAVEDAFHSWINWKGAVSEDQGRTMEAIFRLADSNVKDKFNELTQIRRKLAKILLSGKSNKTTEEFRREIDDLTKKKEFLEIELNQLNQRFTKEKALEHADKKRIDNLLPPNSVYIDFAMINSYDFKKIKWSTPRCLAFLMIPGKESNVKLIDLGSSEIIDKHIRSYRKEINKIHISGGLPNQEVLKRESRALYDLIMKPLRPFIQGKNNIFISPDGTLNLLPFEILINSKGNYIIEDHVISYVGAGRDILRFTDTTSPTNESLIMADPDYNMELKDKDNTIESLGAVRRIRGAVSRNSSGLNFSPLPDTRQEAEIINRILKVKQNLKVKSWFGKQALEEVLLNTERPHIVHLATHGYFLNDEEVPMTDIESRGISIVGQGDFTKVAGIIENPMLRSGIVLAGVNKSLKEGRDDGMVSAMKILGLNLSGTDLVVLSACETGMGDVKNGEGVFGLKRAFILSGAKTLVVSLWSVPSAETTELMASFYDFMSKGRSKVDALRHAKIQMMKKRPHPFYWGAFVLTGKPN